MKLKRDYALDTNSKSGKLEAWISLGISFTEWFEVWLPW